jgi:hypothetical protein
MDLSMYIHEHVGVRFLLPLNNYKGSKDIYNSGALAESFKHIANLGFLNEAGGL